jgi:hypothetical protein
MTTNFACRALFSSQFALDAFELQMFKRDAVVYIHEGILGVVKFDSCLFFSDEVRNLALIILIT